MPDRVQTEPLALRPHVGRGRGLEGPGRPQGPPAGPACASAVPPPPPRVLVWTLNGPGPGLHCVACVAAAPGPWRELRLLEERQVAWVYLLALLSFFYLIPRLVISHKVLDKP